MATFADIIGLIGVFLVLLAYLLLQINRLSAANISYSLLNCLGSAMILFSLFFRWNLSAALVEGAWVAISAIGIWKALSARCRNSLSKTQAETSA